MQQALERHQGATRTAEPPAEHPSAVPAQRGAAVAPHTPWPPTPAPRRSEQRTAVTRERRQARYDEVVARHSRGLSELAIRLQTGVSRATIIRWSNGQLEGQAIGSS